MQRAVSQIPLALLVRSASKLYLEKGGTPEYALDAVLARAEEEHEELGDGSFAQVCDGNCLLAWLDSMGSGHGGSRGCKPCWHANTVQPLLQRAPHHTPHHPSCPFLRQDEANVAALQALPSCRNDGERLPLLCAGLSASAWRLLPPLRCLQQQAARLLRAASPCRWRSPVTHI